MTGRLLCAALLLVGCSQQPKRTPIIVYSPHGKDMLAAFERTYESAFPSHDVQWLDMGAQDVYDRIRTERGNPQADVWWGGPSITFLRAEQESLLARYVPSWDTAVGPAMKSAGGYWYGTFVTPEVIMFNTHVLNTEDVPKDWDDLLDPRWRGKIIVRSPLASGTMRIIFGALIQREEARTGSPDAGFVWLRRLDANTKTYAADPTQLYLKIAREEGMLTVWNLPDVLIQIQRNQYPFGYAVPASGTPLITEGIAIVRGAPHPAEARSFYEFVSSEASLLRQIKEFGRIPARKDLPVAEFPPWLRSLRYTSMPVDWAKLSANEREWMRRWDTEVKGRGGPH
jgi:iron(III) transport system substrate-binding protein